MASYQQNMAFQSPSSNTLPQPNELHSNMTPTRALELISDAGLKGFSEEQITYHLQACAIKLYNHEKLSQRYQHRIPVAADLIASYLYGAHSQQYLPNSPGILLPNQFSGDTSLPIHWWEGVYFALYAEVQIVHEDLRSNWMPELAHGQAILHDKGEDGTATNQHFTAIDLAELLGRMWDSLTDPRLIGPLEIQIRFNTLAENFLGEQSSEEEFREYWQRLDNEEKRDILKQAGGMRDPTSRTPTSLLEWLVPEASPPDSPTTSHQSPSGGMEVHPPAGMRGRSASNLAFVPEGNPAHLGRRGKDPTPLDFYGDGQRYPPFRPAPPPAPAPAVYGAGDPHREVQPQAGGEQPPPPDFIAPRPGVKQRYVSAGGDLPLRERPELEGFSLPSALTPGTSMKKEDVLRSLSSSSPPKTSTEGGPSSSQTSGGRPSFGDRGRDRKRSSTSFRGVRGWFSRRNSSNKE